MRYWHNLCSLHNFIWAWWQLNATAETCCCLID